MGSAEVAGGGRRVTWIPWGAAVFRAQFAEQGLGAAGGITWLNPAGAEPP